MPEVHHATVFFTGRVQGVGFRYQALQVAKGIEVSGFVQNLPDGRVLLEVEGAINEVRDFIAAVEERMTGFIRKTERTAASCVAKYFCQSSTVQASSPRSSQSLSNNPSESELVM